MKSGKWPVTGSPIQIGKSGTLLDGQNRLQAIIDSGATIRMLVVEGVNDHVFDVIDGGARRTASDTIVVLGWEGWLASCGATAVRVANNLLGGRWPYDGALTSQQVREFIENDSEIMASVQFMERLPRKPIPMPHSAAAALHYIMCKRNRFHADLMMNKLFRGDGMDADDIMLKLRNNLLDRYAKGPDIADHTLAISAVIKAWNAIVYGRGVKNLTSLFKRTEDKFPEVK